MRGLLKTMLLLLLLATVAQAEVFRCRDTNGRLVFTDDPARFPPGCRQKSSSPSGAVNVVPMQVPAGTSQETEAYLRARDQKQQAERQQMTEWLDAAHGIAENYRQAQRQRYYPRLHTQAGTMAALATMSQAAQDKATLLQSMSTAGASQDQMQEVSRLLEEVKAP
jgi:Domain of unknown function (DUF4124)